LCARCWGLKSASHLLFRWPTGQALALSDWNPDHALARRDASGQARTLDQKVHNFQKKQCCYVCSVFCGLSACRVVVGWGTTAWHSKGRDDQQASRIGSLPLLLTKSSRPLPASSNQQFRHTISAKPTKPETRGLKFNIKIHGQASSLHAVWQYLCSDRLV
jgi:hypothetical protein